MKILESEGCCIDAVSPGEVYTAKKLGFDGQRILFTGNNITNEDVPICFPIKDNKRYNIVAQADFHSIPGSPIAYWASDRVREIFKKSEKVSDYADVITGMTIGDNNLYMRSWSEVDYRKINIEEIVYEDIDLKEKNFFLYNNRSV